MITRLYSVCVQFFSFYGNSCYPLLNKFEYNCVEVCCFGYIVIKGATGTSILLAKCCHGGMFQYWLGLVFAWHFQIHVLIINCL